MQIKIGVNKKLGQPNFGSAGASCEITLDLSEQTVSDHPDSLVTEIRRAYALAEEAVQEQLLPARQAACAMPDSPDRREPPPISPPERPQPAPDYGDRPSQTQPPSYPEPVRQYPMPHQRPEPEKNYWAGQQNGGSKPELFGRPPRRANQVYPWAKRLEDIGQCPGLLNSLASWGLQAGVGPRTNDWPDAAIPDALAACLPAQPQQPQRQR